jgi:very-short-patch-repair endonuclease
MFMMAAGDVTGERQDVAMVSHLDGAARAMSNRQHGVISRSQARAIGLSDTAIQRRITVGLWRRIVPGVYSTAGEPTELMVLAAATLSLPAVVSHVSAARLRGLRGLPVAPPSVTVPHRLSNRFPGIRVHESTDLAPAWVDQVQGIPTTTVARTMFDLGAVVGRTLHANIVEMAVIDRAVTLDELEMVLAAIGRRGRPGTTAMRGFLDAADRSTEAVESELERRFILLIRRAGLPEPQVQAALPWRKVAVGRVDFLFPASRLIVEVDGRAWHATSKAFVRDRQRDNAAQLAGYRILRFTWEDLKQRPHLVVDQLRTALRQSGAA